MRLRQMDAVTVCVGSYWPTHASRGGAPGGAAPTPTGAEASPASRWGRSQGSAKAGLAKPLAPSQVGYTRLAHINEPISGKPEIGCAPFPRLEGKGKGTGLPAP